MTVRSYAPSRSSSGCFRIERGNGRTCLRYPAIESGAVTWAIVSILIFINALYVAAEFSAVSVRRSRIRSLAEDGNRFARLLLPYLDDPAKLDRYVAACQIGITISSLVLGAYGQARLAPRLVPLFEQFGGMQQVAAESTAAIFVLIGLTVLQMVLGELVPKSLALQFPTPMALYTALPMKWSQRAMSWFILILNGSGVFILRALGGGQSGHRHLHSPEEIEYLITESTEGGMLEAQEHDRLRRALHLSTRHVEDIMVPRVDIVAVDVNMPFDEVRHVVSESPYSRLPVYRQSLDRMIGFVHVQDIVRNALNNGPTDISMLIRPVLVVPAGLTAERVLEHIRDGRQHMAIVVDEFGGTKGLVTIGDVLDEIFGGIADEADDQQVPDIHTLADGRIRMPGWTRLDELQVVAGVSWEGESYTVAGMIAEILGRIPVTGDTVHVDGADLEVESVRAHVAEWVVVKQHV